jgi:hypothetical protein
MDVSSRGFDEVPCKILSENAGVQSAWRIWGVQGEAGDKAGLGGEVGLRWRSQEVMEGFLAGEAQDQGCIL